jgi:hypothetical protein
MRAAIRLVSVKLEAVQSATQTHAGRTSLIVAAAPNSGDFLHAIPCSAVGTRLDDISLRVAVAVRLVASMCAPHTHAFVASTSIALEHTDSSAVGPPAVTFVTMQSTT